MRKTAFFFFALPQKTSILNDWFMSPAVINFPTEIEGGGRVYCYLFLVWYSKLQSDLHCKNAGQPSTAKFADVQIIAVGMVTDKKAVNI